MAAKKSKVQRQRDAALLKEIDETRALLAEFGLTAFGYDPGVVAFLKDDPHQRTLNFDRAEWAWLRPLLKELHCLRARDRKGPG